MSTKGKRDFRPEYHFTPEKMWMNDPNGMAYVDGIWHLCYQYYPDDTVWGPMHWGHAVSKDLIHWEHLPIALEPDEVGMAFSGSMIYDRENVSGLKAPFVAMYTSHGEWEQQSIAYSTDGVHFEKYKGNPVIANRDKRDFRDPKLFWNPVRNCYGVVLAAGDHAEFYASGDLKNWEKTGEFYSEGEWCGDAVWECPDLFFLPAEQKEADGETTQGGKWILLISINTPREDRGSAIWYFSGEFDGSTFMADNEPALLDEGFDNYAAVTWSGCSDCILMGWASNWLYAAKLPTGEFCGQMTFARKLFWREGKNGECGGIVQLPVTEPDSMAGMQKIEWNWGEIGDGKTEEGRTNGRSMALTSEIVHLSLSGKMSGKAGKVRFQNSLGQELAIGIDEAGHVYVDRSRSLPLRSSGEEVFDEIFASEHYGRAVSKRIPCGEKGELNRELDIYWDHSVLEVYADGGRIVLTMLAYPDEPYDSVTVDCIS